MDKRQIVLDTETTGLEVNQGHRIIEIGCVEMVNRRITGRHYHQYIHPQRDIDAGAMEVHGITLEFLAGKPNFEEVATEFAQFVEGAELTVLKTIERRYVKESTTPQAILGSLERQFHTSSAKQVDDY